MTNIKDNLYSCNININYIGCKYDSNCKYYLMENNKKIGKLELNHSKISKYGLGLYCFWTCNTLYFSSSDNSNPITNDSEYSIDIEY